MDNNSRRNCTKCKLSRPVTWFYVVGKMKDGTPKYHSHCAECKNNYNVEYMRKKRESEEFRQKEAEYLKQYHLKKYGFSEY